MADKNPQKLAAARKMLKEYQKRSKETNVSIQPNHQTDQLAPNCEITLSSKREDTMSNTSSTQNYVYDSGTSDSSESKEIVSSKLNEESTVKDNSLININNVVLNGNDAMLQNSSLIGNVCYNNNNSKSNEHYVSQLVSELNNQQVFTKDNSEHDVLTRNIENNEVKSAKDFFNSLPVSSQSSSVDFSFEGQLNIDQSTPVSSSNTSTGNNDSTVETIAGVPSMFADTPSSLYKNTMFNGTINDSQSDRSESVPLTPSEHEKSESTSSSSVSQSPKHVSKVLELQLKEVDTKLGIEINKNTILTEQIQKAHYHINQLERSIETIGKERDSKIDALEEKLHLHVKTLEILVSEKTELQTALTTCQEGISQKAGEMEELQGRLKASRHRVGDLERELSLAQALRQQQEKSAHEATLSKEVLKKEVDLIRKHLDESTEDVLDLKYKLEEKCKEVVSLNDEIKEKNSQLSLSQLRIEQLSVDGSEDQNKVQCLIVSLQDDNAALKQQVEHLNSTMKVVATEKDDASSQYQQYVTSLNSQLQSMAAKYDAVSNEYDHLKAREKSLVEHVASLEKQMQQTLPRKPSPPPSTAAITSLQQQNAELQQFKRQYESVSDKLEQLEKQLTLKTTENERLCVALEEYSVRVNDLERHVERIESDRPDANLLQAAIESDKIAASRAIAQNTELKNQLEELQDAFIKLSNSKLELTEKLEQEKNHCKELNRQLAQTVNTNQVEDSLETSKNIETADFCMQTYNVKAADVSDNIVIDLEAMAKLEEKFKNKMQEVAELSDEKQRLEHLVLQLQHETETIGEYVALYQIQRGMLRQRVQEKDEQMAKLSQEREVLREKLNELNHLVTTLLPESYNQRCDLMPVGTNLSKDEVHEATEETTDKSSMDESSSDSVNRNKITKIRTLITEIGSSKLVTSDGEAPNFHPCPWCSGRLITV